MRKSKKTNRKLIYGIVALPILVGLFLSLKYFFGFFTPYNSWTARQDIKNGEVQLISVGLPYMPELAQQVAKQYDFRYCYSGCMVNPWEMNGIDCYNEVVREYLANKHGNDFWAMYDAKISRVYNIADMELNTGRVLDLVRNLELVQNKLKHLDSEYEVQRNIGFAAVLKDTVNNIYLVNMYEDIDTSRVTYFNFLVDATFDTIINADGKLKGE